MAPQCYSGNTTVGVLFSRTLSSPTQYLGYHSKILGYFYDNLFPFSRIHSHIFGLAKLAKFARHTTKNTTMTQTSFFFFFSFPFKMRQYLNGLVQNCFSLFSNFFTYINVCVPKYNCQHIFMRTLMFVSCGVGTAALHTASGALHNIGHSLDELKDESMNKN